MNDAFYYRKLISQDLTFHIDAPYNASLEEPIHRWLLIPESPSTKWAKRLINDFGKSCSFIFDPFVGSGTVALESARHNLPFIGADILPDLVISTIAKLSAPFIDLPNLYVLKRVTEHYIATHESCFLNLEVTNPTFVWFLKNLQLEILNCNVSETCKIAFLTVIYRSLRYSQLNTKFLQWKNIFLVGLKQVFTDLEYAAIHTKHSDWCVCLGDSRTIDWQSVLNSISIHNPQPALMITSCTYINTSQSKNRLALLSSELGTIAGQTLGLSPKCPTIASIAPYGVLFNLKDTSLPFAVLEYLESISRVLTFFRSICTTPSWVILENENPFLNGHPIEVDLLICKIADDLGFNVHRILLTHYLDMPGKLSTIPTLRRGSLIQLYL